VPEAVQLDKVTAGTFFPYIESPFNIDLSPSVSLTLTLNNVADVGQEVPGRRRAFSLIFLGPIEPILPQRIYALEHASFGTLEIFIVPIGVTQSNCRYEAVFT
jgi:hypothetical protein